MSAQHSVATARKRMVVVDPRLDDYRCLSEPARKHLLRLTLTTTGRSALRLAPTFGDALWLVSPQLPDMDGLDLLEMLHSLQGSIKAAVIDNEYDRERELRSLQLRAIQYVCKPFQLSWLTVWHGLSTAPNAESRPTLSQKETASVPLWEDNEPSVLK